MKISEIEGFIENKGVYIWHDRKWLSVYADCPCGEIHFAGEYRTDGDCISDETFEELKKIIKEVQLFNKWKPENEGEVK